MERRLWLFRSSGVVFDGVIRWEIAGMVDEDSMGGLYALGAFFRLVVFWIIS